MICHTEKLLKLAETTSVNELYKSEALKFAMKCGAIYGSYILYMAYSLILDNAMLSVKISINGCFGKGNWILLIKLN